MDAVAGKTPSLMKRRQTNPKQEASCKSGKAET